MENKLEKLTAIYNALLESGAVANKKQFAALLGVEYTNLTAALKGNPRSLTDSLVAKAIALSEGKSLTPAPDDGAILRGKVIPFFDAEAAAGNQYGMDMTPRASPLALIEIGNVLADSELAVRVYGNSMVPNYPAGCVIGVKETHETFIVPGSVYVVETGENRYLKRLYYAAGKDALRCVSDNTMTHESGPMRGEYVYPDFEIPLKDVKRLWQVVGVIKRNLI